MKKIFTILLFLSFFFLWPKDIQAVDQGGPGAGLGPCTYLVKDVNGKEGPLFAGITGSSPLTWTVGNLIPGNKYRIYTECSSFQCRYSSTQTANSTGKITHTAYFPESNIKNDIWLRVDDASSATNPICDYHIYPSDWNILPSPTPKYSAECKLEVMQNNMINPPYIYRDQDIYLKGTIEKVTGYSKYKIECGDSSYCKVAMTGPSPAPKNFSNRDFVLDNTTKTFTLNLGRNWPDGNYSTEAKVRIEALPFSYWASTKNLSCGVNFNIPGGVLSPYPTSNPLTPIPYPSLAPLCDQLPGEFQVDCKDCIEGQHGIWTAIGCIAPDLGSFISEQLLGVGVGIAGGIAFLYFLYGAFLFLTSRGNPEQIAMGREIIMSSLLGLALIIFSVFLLRVIAVDILDLKPFDFK